MQSIKLLRAFHAVCAAAGLSDDEKHALVGSFGVTSSKHLSDAELNEAIQMVGGRSDGDKWRKRVLCAIDGYLAAAQMQSSPDIIKGIACRASGYEKFNAIPVARLQNLYNAFLNKRKDMKAVDKVASGAKWTVYPGGKLKATKC